MNPQREILTALRHVVRAPHAFCYTDVPGSRAPAAGAQLVDDAFVALPRRRLCEVLPVLDVHRAADGAPRRRYLQEADWFGVEAASASTATLVALDDDPSIEAPANALVVPLQRAGTVVGVAGVWRRASDERFDQATVGRLAQLEPLLSSVAIMYAETEGSRRRTLLKDAVPFFSGTFCVIDRDANALAYVCRTGGPELTERELDEPALVALARRALDGAGRSDTGGEGASLRGLKVVQVADLGEQPLFGGRAAVVALQRATRGRSADLSQRELQIGRLLVNGFSCLNAAAMLDLSPSTVRTYIRRLYKKLGATNRADLTRRWPHDDEEPQSRLQTSSAIARHAVRPGDSMPKS